MAFDLKGRRQALDMTLQDLADKVGVQASTIRKWENGMIDNIKQDKIPKLAEALNVSVFDILDYYPKDQIVPKSDLVKVPIIGTIACGTPIFSEENIEGYIYEDNLGVGDFFALHAKGDSMNPTIQNGDLVTIRKQPVAENGDVVAVCIDGEITLKRFKKTSNQTLLLPDNPCYNPIVLTNAQQSYIVGKAVSLTKKL